MRKVRAYILTDVDDSYPLLLFEKLERHGDIFQLLGTKVGPLVNSGKLVAGQDLD